MESGAEEVRRELERLLAQPVTGMSPVGGGDIGQSFRATTRDERLFVKLYESGAGPAMVAAEAHGLAWLDEPGAIRLPEVRAVGGLEPGGPSLLVLEWLEPGRPGPATDETLGRGLAALHDATPAGFGLETDNFIGRLPQPNAPCETWVDFYRDRRLVPMLDRARGAGLLTAGLAALADRLLDVLPARVGPEAPPARLHGDLWSGNWLCGPEGRPVLIDPAVYGGHREVDLAMMELFGGFSDRVFDAYAEATDLADDWRERVPLYQLYPLLVHLNLFGAAYAGAVERAIRACL